MHWIVFSLNDERRRSLFCRMDVRVGRKVLLRDREISRINNHRKIRAATHQVRSIDWIVKAFIEMCAQRGSEVCSRGEAEDANTVWVDVPLCCVRTHDTHRALRVLQSCRGRSEERR